MKSFLIAAVSTGSSVAAFLAAYNAVGTAIVITGSAILILHRLWVVFVKKQKDPSDDFPTGK